ncbi:hypothetical protein KKI95_06925 [Xenorhabdus bovienii]|uniref:hypothetical protein n=1 Tax=Xenorhabdus TaxID=626 RepID=UPI0003A8EAC9|nr:MULTISPECIES: hypothetical protein [Xenorhabdus]MBD2798161.1 hypothetical protein [Xenorhabdus sp. 18]MDE1476000.1 hypothetical protein [Xenorhabdus bovienii]MDE1495080.1 hypothetical protein [Xenorhabdus bovienii]MDE9435669.1 hypothetical protein [Xenorhabdus bovienii]MDE9457928.1 hypothetical protein [Xenorhabdus bovienii]
MINPLVGNFYQCACYRLFNGGSGREGIALPEWLISGPRTLSESPPSILINGRGSRND